MNNNKGLVIGIGELLFDVFPDEKKLGGAPVNFAYHVAREGIDSIAVSAVGNDADGDDIMRILKEKNVCCDVARVDFPTGIVKVTLDGKGVPSFEICEDVAWDKIPLSDGLIDAASNCRAFCFGTLAQRDAVSRATINRLLEVVPRDSGTLVVYDINLRQQFYSKEIIEDSLSKCNVLKINNDEFGIVAPMLGLPVNDFETGSRRLMQEYGLKMVVLTCGEDGSWIYTADESSFMETPKVDVVDTVGAGDSFTAALCASLLKGQSIRAAHQRAVEVSAFVCTKTGAMPD